ncbi:MAG: phosphoribosyl-ATP diphosphatase [Bradyrhizobium sp.]|nr:phosphoribosyl-ATP diphosphatase [Bradyrhizobium sp.]
MTDANKNPTDLTFSASRKGTTRRGAHRPSPTPPATGSGAGRPPVRSDELDRLHRALADVTPQTHPRTAKLLASSTRKTAQKVIEEAGEVALEAVRHHAGGVVRESADLLYHLVALWRRAGIDPQQVWAEMRARADMLGIAEKRPKKIADKTSPKTVKACSCDPLPRASTTQSPKAEQD